MKTNFNKIFLALFIVLANFYNAQSNGPGCDPFKYPNGCPKSPIDLYLYILGGIAIFGIVYFGRRYKAQKL
ncbi:signal peptidase [Chryseobacterium sp.]|uniref:signal peptidase n=1 Tax=Chryseobacterium sp. TaxID=1871047 RepID=UPI0038905868